MENLADIEALALRCRSDESKSYIAEAIRCYRASAYRAAIVNTWIAIVFDLIDKIRELSLSGDAKAKELETRYEMYIDQIQKGNTQGIKSALEFERSILNLCKDELQFFDSQQFTDLVRLREDRHRCAHPSFQHVGIPYHPSAEQARLHIRNAIVYVLAQPPVQGKAALAELKVLVSSAYFPDNKQKAVAQLESSSLRNATSSLIKGFVDQLVLGFLNDQDSLFLRTQTIAALNGAFELYPVMVEERLTKQLNKVIRDIPDHNFPSAVCLVAYVEQAWSVIDQVSKDKVSEFIKDGPVDDVLCVLIHLAQFDEIRSVVAKRINTLEFDELDKAINSHNIGNLGKARAISLLAGARSWNSVNEIFSKLVLPVFESLVREDITRIIRMPTETGADLRGATGYRLFIEKVRESGVVEDHELNQLLNENNASYLVPQQNNVEV